MGQTAEWVGEEVTAALASGAPHRALEMIAHAYLDTVYAYCCRMLNGDPGRARDVTQQVFEEVCKGIAAFRGESSAKTWLLAIARNQCLKEIASRSRRGDLLHHRQNDVAYAAHRESSGHTETALLSREGLTRLQWGLDQLDPESRSLLAMRFGLGAAHEVSMEELAALLGVSRASAYRKLKEALARLKRMVDDDAA